MKCFIYALILTTSSPLFGAQPPPLAETTRLRTTAQRDIEVSDQLKLAIWEEVSKFIEPKFFHLTVNAHLHPESSGVRVIQGALSLGKLGQIGSYQRTVRLAEPAQGLKSAQVTFFVSERVSEQTVASAVRLVNDIVGVYAPQGAVDVVVERFAPASPSVLEFIETNRFALLLVLVSFLIGALLYHTYSLTQGFFSLISRPSHWAQFLPLNEAGANSAIIQAVAPFESIATPGKRGTRIEAVAQSCLKSPHQEEQAFRSLVQGEKRRLGLLLAQKVFPGACLLSLPSRYLRAEYEALGFDDRLELFRVLDKNTRDRMMQVLIDPRSSEGPALRFELQSIAFGKTAAEDVWKTLPWQKLLRSFRVTYQSNESVRRGVEPVIIDWWRQQKPSFEHREKKIA